MIVEHFPCRRLLFLFVETTCTRSRTTRMMNRYTLHASDTPGHTNTAHHGVMLLLLLLSRGVGVGG